MAKPRTNSPARYDMVMGQLMEAAERLFAQNGVAGTTLQDLADEVGLTRTAVYHYVKGKDQMLEVLIRGFTIETAEDLRRLRASREGLAYERLREGVTNMAERVARNPQRFRLLLTSEGALPDSLANQYLQARRETLSALTDLVSQSISAGSCRAVDPELAAFSLRAASNWVAFWYPRRSGAGSKSPHEVAEGLADLALGVLLAGRVSSATDGVRHVLGLLRGNLGRVERMLDQP